MGKKFRIPSHEIKPVLVGKGSCVASDRITVDGKPVGFMYREEPDDDLDSGWRFFAGDESQAYADDQDHFQLYDLNTIANYDPGILSLLESPPRSAFERDPTGASFRATQFPAPGLE